LIYFNPDIFSAQILRGRGNGAGAGERIKHDAASFGEGQNKRNNGGVYKKTGRASLFFCVLINLIVAVES